MINWGRAFSNKLGEFGFDAGFWSNQVATISPTLPSDFPDLLQWFDVGDDDTYVTLATSAATGPGTWSSGSTNQVTGSKADPVGGTSAWELVEAGGAAAAHSYGLQFVPARVAGEIEFDVYVKRASGIRHAAIGRTSSECIVVNLDDGAITTIGTIAPGHLASVTSVGGGWWRVRGFVTAATAPNVFIWITNSPTVVVTYVGDGSSGLYVYQADGLWARQRQVGAIAPRAGSLTGSLTNSVNTLRPNIRENHTLGKRVVGSYNTGLVRGLTGSVDLASALSGVDKPFTWTVLGRYNSTVSSQDGLWLSGSVAQHCVLATSSSYKFIQRRDDNVGLSKTMQSSSFDFTPDQNYHATSVVFDGNTSQLWIDGQVSTSSFDLGVGDATFTSVTDVFQGREWREQSIHARALTSTEVIALQNGMRSRAGLSTFSLENPLNIPGVQGYWEVDSGIILSTASINADLTAWTPSDLYATGSVTSSFTLVEGVGAATQHYMESPAATNLATGLNIFSVDLKKAVGGRQWAALVANQSTLTTTYFDLVSGALGTQGTGVEGSITSLGDGWFKCSIAYTMSATPARIYVAEADGDITMNGSGVTAYEARNVGYTQYRVARWNTTGPAPWALIQATANSQPFYFSGSYVTGSQIGGRPAVGENQNVASETMTVATPFASIWSGYDAPMSMVGLYNKTGAPGSNTAMLILGGTATHNFVRITTTNNVTDIRTDNAASSITVTHGACADGIATFADIFTGTSSSFYRDGTQIGTTSNLDVGECTFSTTFTYSPRNLSTRGFCLANRELTSTERVALETGFKRRGGLL